MPSVPHLNSRAARQHCQRKENEDLTSEEEAESDEEEEVEEVEEEKRDNLLELIVQAQVCVYDCLLQHLHIWYVLGCIVLTCI